MPELVKGLIDNIIDLAKQLYSDRINEFPDNPTSISVGILKDSIDWKVWIQFDDVESCGCLYTNDVYWFDDKFSGSTLFDALQNLQFELKYKLEKKV